MRCVFRRSRSAGIHPAPWQQARQKPCTVVSSSHDSSPHDPKTACAYPAGCLGFSVNAITTHKNTTAISLWVPVLCTALRKGVRAQNQYYNIILSQQQQDFNSLYLLFAIISKDYTVVKGLTSVHFLRSVLFYRTSARSFLANFMQSITFKAIPHNWTKTPQLSLCGVALNLL